MAYDLILADRTRLILEGEASVTERRMFRGIAFMLAGNMSVGVLGDELMVRVGAPSWSKVLELTGVREMDFSGRSMKGFVLIDPERTASDEQLEEWVERGVTFALTLPAK
jgi:TfoX N-terminal domain